MINLYTAVGKYDVKKDPNGMMVPSVTVNGKEKMLGTTEMILWTTLLWNIMTYQEIEKAYKTKAEAVGIDPDSFDTVLQRLELRNLVVHAEAIKGNDALYQLLSNLYLVPVRVSLPAKIWTFFNLITKERVPIIAATTVLRKERYSKMEKKVIQLSKQALLSSAEIVKCIGTNITDVSTREKVLDALYDDDTSTCDNLAQMIWIYDEHKSVMEAISMLYLNRNIVFDKLF